MKILTIHLTKVRVLGIGLQLVSIGTGHRKNLNGIHNRYMGTWDTNYTGGAETLMIVSLRNA